MRLLLSTISLPILLVAASAEAGQIVWRSPVAGILQVAASTPVTPSNPEGEESSMTLGVSIKPQLSQQDRMPRSRQMVVLLTIPFPWPQGLICQSD